MKTRQVVAGALASAALFVMAGTSHATVLTSGDITVNAGGGGTETKIFFDSVTNTTSGTGHVGSQAGDPGTPLVSFTTNIASDFANGYATITPNDNHTSIHQVTFSVPTGWFFTDALFSTLQTPGGQGQAGLTIFAFKGGTGGTEIGHYSNDDVGSGLNDWLTVAINGKQMDTIVITAISGTGFVDFDQLKQFNLSGLVFCSPTGSGCAPPPPPPGVPLPAALPLFAGGVGLLGFLGWRRKKKMA